MNTNQGRTRESQEANEQIAEWLFKAWVALGIVAGLYLWIAR